MTEIRPPETTAPRLPATPGETVNTLAHFHRAEIARMAGWRDRIDRTTNWAITVVAAMLSVSLSTPTAHHGVLIFAMLLVLLLLWIEARRYRFFDVYRVRVRRMERHYFSEVFWPAHGIDPGWAQLMSEDLRRPQFLISHRAAMARRLRRNYGWMFLILLGAWVLKVTSLKLQEPSASTDVIYSFEAIARNATLGPLPGWLVMAGVAVFYAWLGWATLRAPNTHENRSDGDVHV